MIVAYKLSGFPLVTADADAYQFNTGFVVPSIQIRADVFQISHKLFLDMKLNDIIIDRVVAQVDFSCKRITSSAIQYSTAGGVVRGG